MLPLKNKDKIDTKPCLKNSNKSKDKTLVTKTIKLFFLL